MSRCARKDIVSKFVHVMIQGINKEYIFKDEIEIKTYLKYLVEKLKDSNLKVISYCIMNNHAHFIIYFDNISEISRLMSRINTKYAMFYNYKNKRCGIVFRNRYKSEQILTWSHLVTCIKYIHNNPVKAGMCEIAEDYQYSSYNEYKKGRGIILDWTFIKEIMKELDISLNYILDKYEGNEKINFIEYDDIDKKEILKNEILLNFMREKHIKDALEISNNKIWLKEIVYIMCHDYQLCKTEVAKLLKIERTKIYRILKDC